MFKKQLVTLWTRFSKTTILAAFLFVSLDIVASGIDDTLVESSLRREWLRSSMVEGCSLQERLWRVLGGGDGWRNYLGNLGHCCIPQRWRELLI